MHKSLFSVFHTFRVNVTVLEFWKNAAIGLRATGVLCISMRKYSTHRWSSRMSRWVRTISEYPSGSISLGSHPRFENIRGEHSNRPCDTRRSIAKWQAVAFVSEYFQCLLATTGAIFALLPSIVTFLETQDKKIDKSMPFAHSVDIIFYLLEWSASIIYRIFQCRWQDKTSVIFK